MARAPSRRGTRRLRSARAPAWRPHRAAGGSPPSLKTAALGVPSDGVFVWITTAAGANVRIEVDRSPSFEAPCRSRAAGLDRHNDFKGAVLVQGLVPDELWFRPLVAVGSGAPVSRTGRLRTVPMTPRLVTFVCIDERYEPLRRFDTTARGEGYLGDRS